MNRNHVEVIEKVGKELLASPPKVILVEDYEGDFINWGGVLIRHATYESPSILGTVKSAGYAVDVEVYDGGSRWEPPSVDISEQGVFPSFLAAVAKAASLHVENWLRCWGEHHGVGEDAWASDLACRNAWADGYAGYKDGRGEKDNPHPEESELGRLWRQGYGEGESEQAHAEYLEERRRNGG